VTAQLDRVWGVLAERLQRNGLRTTGRVTIAHLTRDERHALAGLLGHPVPNERATIDLARLDERLRSTGTASGLVALVERQVGALVDRPGARRAQQSMRDELWTAGRDLLASSGLVDRSWVEPWLDDVRRARVLGRLDTVRAKRTLVTAVHCITHLPAINGSSPVARGDLASMVTGNAHALDDGTALASLVLRAAALIVGEPYARAPARRRHLWRAVDIQTDEVSTTVLTIGLRSAAGGTWLDERTSAGWETHLTARDLRRLELRPADHRVFVAENPRLLEQAIDRGTSAAAVCTHGQPAVVVLAALDQLRAAGAELWYHGDFDWPGIAIAERLIGIHGCRPWRMSAEDYLDGLATLAPLAGELPTLEGNPVAASWDPDLTAVMAQANRAIHEELLLEILLADMTGARSRSQVTRR
jgi:uncharacterized protein (TIGR02679 family)